MKLYIGYVSVLYRFLVPVLCSLRHFCTQDVHTICKVSWPGASCLKQHTHFFDSSCAINPSSIAARLEWPPSKNHINYSNPWKTDHFMSVWPEPFHPPALCQHQPRKKLLTQCDTETKTKGVVGKNTMCSLLCLLQFQNLMQLGEILRSLQLKTGTELMKTLTTIWASVTFVKIVWREWRVQHTTSRRTSTKRLYKQKMMRRCTAPFK